mgnify:FL=1
MANLFSKAIYVISLMLFTSQIMAQGTSDSSAPEVEEIIVTGEIQRGALRSLEVKRNNTVISDALFGAEIGALPDLSIAESMVRITGVASDRYKGGASSMSIRGMGNFLAYSTFNGREMSSGSDGRQVNLYMFPSELVGGTVVYKAQQASFTEGGIAGTMELKGLKPIDYGKRRLQVQSLFGYSEYESRVDDGESVNTRYTASFVDNWETDTGRFGIAIGGQLRDDTSPEEVFVTSSSYRPCITQYAEGRDGPGYYDSGNCEMYAPAYTDAAGQSFPEAVRYSLTSAAEVAALGVPFYLVSNQYIWRAMKTDTDRDSFYTTLQWQNDQLDISLDYQFSDRYDAEERANLVLADGRRKITPLMIADNGALMNWTGESRIENQTVFRTQDETYESFGLSFSWSNEAFTFDGDISYNKSDRYRDEYDMRIRRNSRVYYEADRRGTNVPSWVIREDQAASLDLMDHSIYDNGARARRRVEINEDYIHAAKFDLDYAIDGDFLTNIKTGIRISTHTKMGDDGIDCETGKSSDNCSDFALVSGNYASEGAIAARRDSFIVEDFFDGANTDFALTEWATWDALPLFSALTGSLDAGLFDAGASSMSTHDTDVTEDITALYAQGDFSTELFGLPASGNFGLRVVQTDIESTGIRSGFSITDNTEDEFQTVSVVGGSFGGVETNSFTNVLPSVNITFELDEEKLLRFAAYKAIARPDVRQMTAALSLSEDSQFDSAEDTIGQLISAAGNPFLEPLEATNLDISWEWYISDTSFMSIAAYWKELKTGTASTTEQLSIDVDGTPTMVSVIRNGNSDESSNMSGIEFTGRHTFTLAPAPFDKLGIEAGFNIADSDYETPDPSAVGGSAYPMANFVDPANLVGFSEDSMHAMLFWETKDISLKLSYYERSEYFKDFRQGPLRYVGDQGFLNFSASYDLNKNWELRFQGLNLLDEPNVMNRPLYNQVAQSDYSGARYFVGVRGRF